MTAIDVTVLASRAIDPDPAGLSQLERGHLAQIRGERRRDEWIRGRLAVRSVLCDPATSVIPAADGAPRAVGGAPRSVSLSHDGAWIAVAVADEGVRVGIDLCMREHASRVKRILAWLGVTTACDPAVAWAALEVGLKLRRLSVEALRDRELAVEKCEGGIRVRGLGAEIAVTVRDETEYVVAWASEDDAAVPSMAASRAAMTSEVSSPSAATTPEPNAAVSRAVRTAQWSAALSNASVDDARGASAAVSSAAADHAGGASAAVSRASAERTAEPSALLSSGAVSSAAVPSAAVSSAAVSSAMLPSAAVPSAAVSSAAVSSAMLPSAAADQASGASA